MDVIRLQLLLSLSRIFGSCETIGQLAKVMCMFLHGAVLRGWMFMF